MKNNDDYNVMVERSILILDKISNSEKPIGVSQIAKDLDLPKVTTFRILKTLEKYNYINSDENTNYTLGLIFLEYSAKLKNNTSISSILNSDMKKLADDINENVNLGILYKNSILTIKTVEGDSFALMATLEPLTPLHCSSMGKIFLASWPNSRIKAYFDNLTNKSFTHNTIDTYEKFLIEKEKVLEEGVAYDREEYEYGLSCISVPIKNSKNEIIASLGISGPTNRLKFKGVECLVQKLKETSERASKKIKVIPINEMRMFLR